MLKAVPKKEAVDRENGADEEGPPNTPVFEAAIFRALFGGKREIGFVPDDARDFFFWGRGGEQRGGDHDGHAEQPTNNGAVVEGVESAEEFELEQSPTESEAEQDGV